jgi:hypothetical protein
MLYFSLIVGLLNLKLVGSWSLTLPKFCAVPGYRCDIAAEVAIHPRV